MPKSLLAVDASPALAAAIDLAAETTPLCSACARAQGLCVACAERDHSLLPHLAQPHWLQQLMGAKRHELTHARKDSPEVARIKRRKERRNARRADRLGRALNGEFTRTRLSV